MQINKQKESNIHEENKQCVIMKQCANCECVQHKNVGGDGKDARGVFDARQ